MDVYPVQMQLDRRLERNEAFGDADRIIACEMRRVEVHLDKGERLEPEGAAVVRQMSQRK